MCLADTCDVQLCADLDHLAAKLCVIALALIGHLIQFDLTEPAPITRVVVAEDVKRILASVKTFLAERRLVFPIFLADLVPEASALEILVEAFVCLDCHFFTSLSV